MADLRVWIGWDSREAVAYDAARHSLLQRASIDVDVAPIRLADLRAAGLYNRDDDPLASTEFTYSRFLTPHLAGYRDWALFCDCDFLFLADVGELLAYADPAKALYCVQHDHRPSETLKMDGRAQTVYPRKNWSSFMLLNCGHPSTRSLTPAVVNAAPAAYLHRMQWAGDAEIGALPLEWNWLAGWNESPPSGRPKAVHYTSGGPWLPGFEDAPFAEEWRQAAVASIAAGPS